MRNAPLPTPPATASNAAWPLILDAELCEPVEPGTCVERLADLTRRLTHASGGRAVSAELHCSGRCLRVRVTADANDLSGAVELVADRLRACARRAGFGSLVVVGARFAA